MIGRSSPRVLALALFAAIPTPLVACASAPCPASAVAGVSPPASAVASPLASSAAVSASPTERSPSESEVGEPGWLLSGGARDLYTVHRDNAGMRAAWVLEPAGDTHDEYGTWMRAIEPGEYRGKRVRITATYMTRGATSRVDFWARAQGADSPDDGGGLGGASKPLQPDTTWTTKSLELDVPPETASLQYGVGVAGPGKVWLESAKIEVVAHEAASRSDSPSHVAGWSLTGDDVPEYASALDTTTKHSGHASGLLHSTVAAPRGFATLDQWLSPDAYRGKRLKLHAFVRSDAVSGWAGLWMRVDMPSGAREAGAFDNMEERPIKGTTDWAEYAVVLDVAADAKAIAFGVLLHGAGHVWIDDVKFDVVDKNVPTTGRSKKERAGENLDFEK